LVLKGSSKLRWAVDWLEDGYGVGISNDSVLEGAGDLKRVFGDLRVGSEGEGVGGGVEGEGLGEGYLKGSFESVCCAAIFLGTPTNPTDLVFNLHFHFLYLVSFNDDGARFLEVCIPNYILHFYEERRHEEGLRGESYS